MLTVHGTCIDIDGSAVLLRGESGSGKSDLALRIIDDGARLVSDDQTSLSAKDGLLLASPPDSIRGLMEIRGLGILRLPCSENVPLRLVVDLVPEGAIERMPEPGTTSLLDTPVPCIDLPGLQAATPAKVRMALARILHPEMAAS